MRREMIAVLVLVALAAHVVRSQFDDSIRIAVEYSLDGGVTWTPRGTLQTYGAMRRLAYVPIAGTANANWPSAILTKIAQHALRDKNYLYQLRLRRDGFEPIVKSISTCDLVESKFKEAISLHVEQQDKKTNIVSFDYHVKLPSTGAIGVQYSPFAGGCNSATFANLQNAQFTESVAVLAANQLQGPKVAVDMTKLLQQSEGGEKKEEEQSFLRKYWYIVVPIGLILLSSFISPPPESLQSGGQAHETASGE